MPDLENLRKQAKLIVRWHRDRNHPVAQRIRQVLPRYQNARDGDILAGRFTLGEAQELIAREKGFESWQALKAGLATMSNQTEQSSVIKLSIAYPQLFVRDIAASCDYFTAKLGFTIGFQSGKPPFYAQVRRDGARLNLRKVNGPVFTGDVREREQLLAAYIPVGQVKELYRQFEKAGVAFHQTLKLQPWGAQVFVVRDPDDNLIAFASPTNEQD